jgi:6-phosphogluconolactonase (cycloisomerase 2 family)
MAGLSIANEDNDPIVTFRIDRQTGMLSLEGEAIQTGSPVCIIFRSQRKHSAGASCP